MEFSKVISTRCSCRSYTEEPVSDAQLQAVLAAGNAAPVGMGAYQTVYLTVIRNRGFLDAVSKAAGAFLKRDTDPLYGAPVVILVSAKPGIPPTIEFQNTGTIIENMMLAATELGLGSCFLMGPMIAFSDPALRARLGLPEGYEPLIGVALGYAAGERPAPPDRKSDNITWCD